MKQLSEKLTVILPVKGREEFNSRWLTYHGRIGLDSKVLIGDGDPYSKVQSILNENIQASSLDYKYLKFNDKDMFKFYSKLLNLVETAKTPYVMMVDNDDFILLDGVNKAISFLESNLDYVSCGGANLGTYGVTSDFNLANFPQPYTDEWTNLRFLSLPVILDKASAEERVLQHCRNYQPIWYCVHRTETLKQCFRAVLDYGIKDVLVVELFQSLFMAANGKVRQGYDCAVYLRQLNSSMGKKFNSTNKSDVNKMISVISQLVSNVDKKPFDEVTQRAYLAFEEYKFALTSSKKNKFFFIGWLNSWIYTLRAKIPFFHRLMQRREINHVLDIISDTQSMKMNSRHILESELQNVFYSMKYSD